MPTRKTAAEAPAASRRRSGAAPSPKLATPKPPPAKAPVAQVQAAPAQLGGKLGVLMVLMGRPEGATIAAMSEATGWLPHSVRGALSGALKKARGVAILSQPAEGGRIYRIGPTGQTP